MFDALIAAAHLSISLATNLASRSGLAPLLRVRPELQCGRIGHRTLTAVLRWISGNYGSFSLGAGKFIQCRMVQRTNLTQVFLRFLDVVPHGGKVIPNLTIRRSLGRLRRGVPEGDICSEANCRLFDHLVGAGKQRIRYLEPQRPGGL
jgi:hypothetical protein